MTYDYHYVFQSPSCGFPGPMGDALPWSFPESFSLISVACMVPAASLDLAMRPAAFLGCLTVLALSGQPAYLNRWVTFFRGFCLSIWSQIGTICWLLVASCLRLLVLLGLLLPLAMLQLGHRSRASKPLAILFRLPFEGSSTLTQRRNPMVWRRCR